MFKILTGGAYMAAAQRAREKDLKPDERGPPVSLSLSLSFLNEAVRNRWIKIQRLTLAHVVDELR